jgi:hypothetical protein
MTCIEEKTMSDVALTVTIFHTLAALAMLGVMVYGVLTSLSRRD